VKSKQRSRAQRNRVTTEEARSQEPMETEQMVPQQKRGNKNILIIPKMQEGVFNELRKVGGIQRSWVQHHISYEGGATLLSCRDEESANRIKGKLAGHPNLVVKEKTKRDPEVRIHNIRVDYAIEEIQKDVEDRMGSRAECIQLVPDRRNPQIGFAVLKVSEELYNQFESVWVTRVD